MRRKYKRLDSNRFEHRSNIKIPEVTPRASKIASIDLAKELDKVEKKQCSARVGFYIIELLFFLITYLNVEGY